MARPMRPRTEANQLTLDLTSAGVVSAVRVSVLITSSAGPDTIPPRAR